ncbi:hypothetical protein DRW07_01755 [Alteromonas sediminis]|uniref:Uncharacterized protein n=1 Tax=Alteromonas sediminis TaxID=2259342 RepID=A0A3N5Y9W3_9ALTE|nr:hypothetical protein [Alteromonas sediminis]RPJ68159.1 hypothetical protein DRW07_01755 [Alteromonas sediminis]
MTKSFNFKSLFKFLFFTSTIFYSLTFSSLVFAQYSVGVECYDCDSSATKARLTAQSMGLEENDLVSVLDFYSGTIETFQVKITVNERNGASIYFAVATQTPNALQRSFSDLVGKFSQLPQRAKQAHNVTLSDHDNPCVKAGPNGSTFQPLKSVWDLVGCQPAVNFLQELIKNDVSLTTNLWLGASNLTSQFDTPISIRVPVAIELTTDDGGKLHFELVYNVISEDTFIISAQLDIAKSRDGLGNSLDALESMAGGAATGGGAYFGGHNNSAIRQSTLVAFLQAASRMGLTVRTPQHAPEDGLQTKCTVKSDGVLECIPI